MKSLSVKATGLAPIILPIAAILAARFATHTELATNNPGLASILFAWIAADALALAVIAKAPNRRPGLRALLGAIAAGLVIAFVGSAAPVRDAMIDMPPLLVAIAGTLAIYLGWSGWHALSAWRSTRELVPALSEILPARLVHFLLAELDMLRIGLLSWGAKPDVPSDARGFAYHRYLTPMLATFLALQLIELAVVHLIVSQFSETAALILLALSLWGTIWLVALMKSFRLFPVLLSGSALRVRSGRIVDLEVPYASVSELVSSLCAERLAARTTLNLAHLSSPNCCIVLKQPVEYRTFLGSVRKIDAIALRLDESGAFHAAMEESLAAR